jgi:carboxylesterase
MLLIFVAGFATRLYYQHVTREYLQNKFTLIPELNIYTKAQPQFFFGSQKLEHAVLLLHGYSSSPADFGPLYNKLRQINLPYYAPLILGFGLGDMHLLDKVKPSDWLRQALESYDLLAAIAKQVSVIGDSNGAVLAIYVAEKRPVQNLILLAPYFIPSKTDLIYKDILSLPYLAPVVDAAGFYFEKPVRANRVTNVDNLDPVAARNAFHYRAMPISSLKVIWDLQDKVNLARARYQHLAILYGKEDETVDVPKVFAFLKKQNIPCQLIAYNKTAHNLLDDYNKDQVATDIVKILTPESNITTLTAPKINIDQAIRNPTSMFTNPNEVVNAKDLSRDQKIKILHQWEYDVRESEIKGRKKIANKDLLLSLKQALFQLGAKPLGTKELP